MKLTRFNTLICMLLGLTLFLGSCDKEDYNSALPQFGGFKITPEPASSGDSITIEAVQLKKGKLLYRAVYEWKVTCNGELVYQPSTKTVVYDNTPSNPIIKFKMPENLSGECRVEYAGTYHYSGKAPSIKTNANSNNTSQNPLKGSINVTQSGVLYGICKGNVSFDVKAKE